MAAINSKRNVNHPQRDLRCNCCGRPATELEPFDKVGDQFDGHLFIKNYRPEGPPHPKALEVYDKFFSNCPDYDLAWKELVLEFGEEEALKIELVVGMIQTVGSSLECRDCISLDDAEFYQKLGYDMEAYLEWQPGQKCARGPIVEEVLEGPASYVIWLPTIKNRHNRS
jgi:hypothetical protein